MKQELIIKVILSFLISIIFLLVVDQLLITTDATTNNGERVNVTNTQNSSAIKLITTNGNVKDTIIEIDGKPQTKTYPALEKDAHFTFDIKNTNVFFQNAIVVEGKVLQLLDNRIKKYKSISVPIPANTLSAKDYPRISIVSGTKVSPFDTTSEENHDEFTVKNVRLVLSDGTVLRDEKYKNPNQVIKVGDEGKSFPLHNFQFKIPNHKYTAVALNWDTTKEEEGPHLIKVLKKNKQPEVKQIIVDHSAPTITPSIEEGKVYKGKITIDAEIRDVWSEIVRTTAMLDGKEISLPYVTSSAELSDGNHLLLLSARDSEGNENKVTKKFKVAEENPLNPKSTDTISSNLNAKLSVKVQDPTKDFLHVSFYKAFQYTAADRESVKLSENVSSTEPPQAFDQEGEKELSNRAYKKAERNDGKTVEKVSKTDFPYHRFDVKVDQQIDENDLIEIVWKGHSLPGRKVTMYVWSHIDNKWKEVDFLVAGKDVFTLKGSVTVQEYVKDQRISVIVQDKLFEKTKKANYTIAWMSDTQYYSESYPEIFKKQTDWLAENKQKLNIQYVFHTGDLVDDFGSKKQWKYADTYMKTLEDAKLPYGVLAGNHDVGHKDESYDQFRTYFGEKRFKNQAFYGGSYQNNRGHYDLISANGNDFVMVYAGWGVNDGDLKWVDKVLKQHTDRIAILAFHEYLLVSGNRSPIGEKIYNKVVKPNSNVVAVLSGHYHDSETLIDEIDDDGDGNGDRKVYQMLADYQGGPKGGLGFLRLLHVNTDDNTIEVKTYSPYTNTYNYYDPTQYPDKDEFTMQVNLEQETKMVATDFFTLNVYTDALIDKVSSVQSGDVASVDYNNLTQNQTYYWYTRVQDQYHGEKRSRIWGFTTLEGQIKPLIEESLNERGGLNWNGQVVNLLMIELMINAGVVVYFRRKKLRKSMT
ncbi:metallophosphoesterase [Metabacillus herbersteinensis]|uniref:Metallophosphoesterase n=1 Tax=Metabacillus herbersteinensis TaxID=283816 RepID=A0ABV6GI05_9BACI